jgi:hypothetical protein
METFPELPKQVELFYQSQLTNIQFIKKQEWIFTTSALTAYGALATAGKYFFFTPEIKTILYLAIAGSLAFSALIFHGMYKSLDNSRNELDRVLPEYFKSLHEPDKRGYFDRCGIFIGLFLIVSVGAAISAYAVCRPYP